MSKIPVSIAIDGPAGAGKSTVAKLTARKTGYIYVDTGAMYRAMALFLIRRGIGAEDAEAISRVSQEADISIEYRDGEQVVLLDGENVNAFLRTEEVGKMASASSVNADLRRKLVELQQELGARTSVVMDGRDIGTVVLPHAAVKIFLTASVEERAMRRFKELQAKGEPADLDTIAKDIEERDYRDSHRAVSPLKQAEDAILIDSSKMTAEEVAEQILAIWQQVMDQEKEKG
ncbi:MAG: (d)CMP kinase [Lachnospiraceae bacterium]|nr:(d)CMP kinase [Lachnospiraceae bacterium]